MIRTHDFSHTHSYIDENKVGPILYIMNCDRFIILIYRTFSRSLFVLERRTKNINQNALCLLRFACYRLNNFRIIILIAFFLRYSSTVINFCINAKFKFLVKQPRFWFDNSPRSRTVSASVIVSSVIYHAFVPSYRSSRFKML